MRDEEESQTAKHQEQARGELPLKPEGPETDRQSHSRSWRDPDVILNILTLLFILATVGSTLYTVHSDEENRLLPILVLGTEDDSVTNTPTIVIRNIGFGPALNATTHDIDGSTLRLNHRRAIQAQEAQEIDGQDGAKALTYTMPDKPYKRVTPVENVKGYFATEKYVCVSYENARRETYETWHMIHQPNNLAIDFLCQRQKANPCSEQCPKKN